MNFPAELKYTIEHEWIRVEGNIGYVGITDFAQSELGDLVYIEVDTLDEEVAKDDVFGTVEAVKTTSELFMPVSGKVLEFNPDLEDGDNAELINEDPYEKGWIIKVELTNLSELEGLMSADAYKESISVE